jgi:hypothetical protein
MDNRLLSLYLSRILSGQYIFLYNNISYKLIYPDISIKYEAEICAEQEFENIKFNEWIQDDHILYFLIDLGLWSFDGDKKLKELETQIENHKVDLYNNFLNPNKIKNIKKQLTSTRNNYNRLLQRRHSFDHVTHNGFLNSTKNQFILINSLFDKNNNKIFPDYNNIDYHLLNELSSCVSQNIIDIEIFRKIARNDIWKNYWSANNQNLFGKPTINWTDEQKTLTIITKMYDSAAEHPECPPDEILDDDDMFDGWMIIQKKENEKNKNKNRNEKMLKDKKLGNAKEVFLVANSKEEAQNIYGLNDAQSRNIIKERNKVIMNSENAVPEAKLPDVQRDIMIQNNQKFMQSRKK